MAEGIPKDSAGTEPRRKRAVKPWQRRRRRSLVLVAVLGILLASWAIWRMGKRAALNDAIAAAQALGVATTPADYDTRFGPGSIYWEGFASPADSLYLRAVNLYVEAPLAFQERLPSFRGTYDDEDLDQVPYADTTVEAMRAFTETNAETLTALHEATLSGQLGASWEEGAMSALLPAACCVSAHDGDADAVFQYLEDALVILRGGDRSLDEDARAIHANHDALLRYFCGMESALRRVELADGQLARLQSHLVAGDWDTQERKFDLVRRSQNLFEVVSGEHLNTVARAADLFIGFLDTYRTYELKAWCVKHEFFGLSLAEQEARIAKLKDEPWHSFLQPIEQPQLTAVAYTALGVVRYAQRNGALPTSLDALVPDYCAVLPMDFWTGEPLRYKVEGRTFSVYSVGKNRSDDGPDRKKDILFKTALPAPE